MNNVNRNLECEALVMVFALHKFRHYLLGNKFVFYVDHMVLVYLVNKPQVLRCIIRWLLLFLKYESIVVYKLSYTHVITDALSSLVPNTTKPIGVLDQTIDATLFILHPIWLEEVENYL